MCEARNCIVDSSSSIMLCNIGESCLSMLASRSIVMPTLEALENEVTQHSPMVQVDTVRGWHRICLPVSSCTMATERK